MYRHMIFPEIKEYVQNNKMDCHNAINLILHCL